MKFFFPGLIVGILINGFIFSPQKDSEIYPSLYTAIAPIFDSTTPFSLSNNIKKSIAISRKSEYALVNGNGKLLSRFKADNSLVAHSGNGEFAVLYEKTGKEIAFYKYTGERYWKIPSLEYPYLSQKGALILLLNGDSSKVRIIDKNGSVTGDKSISGRLCTSIVFAGEEDSAAVGFMDGSYYCLNSAGIITGKGKSPTGTMVKGLSVSNKGEFIAIHYGSNKNDTVRVVDKKGVTIYEVGLHTVHRVHSTLYCTEEGEILVLDKDRILMVNSSGKKEFTIPLHPQRPGAGKIIKTGDLFTAVYTGSDGMARHLLFSESGAVYYSRELPEETVIDCASTGSTVLLRGNDHLYGYKIYTPTVQ